MTATSPPMFIALVAPDSGGQPTSRRREPVRIGVPIARGECTDARSVRLVDADGRLRSVDARALARWPDGSVKWLLLDFQADHDGGTAPVRYEVRVDGSAAALQADGIRVQDDDHQLAVDTGALVVRFPRRGGFSFPAVLVDGLAATDSERSGVRLWADDGSAAERLVFDAVEIEEAGSVRVVVCVRGSFRRGRVSLDATARLTLHAGSPTIEWALSLRHPGRARHPGGYWELGDRGSVFLRDVSVAVVPAGSPVHAEIACSPEPGAPMSVCSGRFELYQASSGGDNWQHVNHVSRSGAVALPFRGYRLTAGGVDGEGLRATPTLTLAAGGVRLALAMRHFWQNCPKAIEADHDGIVLRLFPRQHPDVHELQGGEQKTHEFAFAFGPDIVTPAPLDWVRAPLVARVDPAQYARTCAVPYLMPAREWQDTEYEALVATALDGDESVDAKRDRIDEYGWRNFGDLYADHEAAFHTGTPPPVSHYNNQYDAIAGFARQFMATGDVRWHRLMSELATHVADVDVYHTRDDKAAYNGGLFWHTSHYVDAGRSTHRSYPRTSGVWGGGPSNEHNYATGLVLHYYLTGSRLSREAALSLAEWVVAMDDGDRTIFRWLARGATGLASATASESYHGPGRGAGNSIVVLLAGHELTGDPRFLAKAEELIVRCIAPDGDPADFDLLNRESRWSYTVFVCALGRYLDHKAERGAPDLMYAYARGSLLGLARWMVANEYPYLDRPDQLDYPTETWAAQEMWKSEAFAFAARYSGDRDERAGLLERSGFFFDYAVRTLSGMPTRVFTRPVVLLLSRGHMHRQVPTEPEAAPPRVDAARAQGRRPFEPQRRRAIRRAQGLAALVLAVGVALSVVGALWWLT